MKTWLISRSDKYIKCFRHKIESRSPESIIPVDGKKWTNVISHGCLYTSSVFWISSIVTGVFSNCSELFFVWIFILVFLCQILRFISKNNSTEAKNALMFLDFNVWFNSKTYSFNTLEILSESKSASNVKLSTSGIFLVLKKFHKSV